MTNLARRFTQYARLTAVALLVGSAFAAASFSTQAADMNELHGRLSPMPVTAATVRTITGVGSFTASLNGSTLSISGQFEGMNSAATAAHVHTGAKAQTGPVAFPIDVTKAMSGTISVQTTLTPELIEALHAESLYIQIHSEGNPGGELRGWLLH